MTGWPGAQMSRWMVFGWLERQPNGWMLDGWMDIQFVDGCMGWWLVERLGR